MLNLRDRAACYVAVAAAALATVGCGSVYYRAMEAIGYEKRDLLAESVEEARDSQQEAKEQFKTALEQFKSVVNFDGGELETVYKKLSRELEVSEKKATNVGKRIADVEKVAGDLFSEWRSELDEFSDASSRRRSEQLLSDTESRYDQLLTAMKRAESKIGPVLAVFNDKVLSLKHNLNAKAIAGLKDELIAVESDVDALVKEMEASVAEADAFLSEFDPS